MTVVRYLLQNAHLRIGCLCGVFLLFFNCILLNIELGADPNGANRRAVQASFSEIVAELAEILGKKLTAYIGGVKDTRVIERWMQGGVEPYRDADQRVRLAYQIAKTLSEHDSPRVVQAWFTGLNPEMQDRTPIRLLREEDVEKVGPELLNAMRAFLAGG